MAAWCRRRTLPSGQWITDEQVRAIAEACGWDEVRAMLMPDLLPGNSLAWSIYQLVATQPIMAPMGGPVFFSIPALVNLMDIYGVPARHRRGLLDKCVFLWNEMHRKSSEGGEQQ